MESQQFKSRKTDSNNWEHDKQHLMQKGASWPLYAAVSAYAMNTFTSTALQGLSPFELVFARKPRQLTSFELPKLTSFPVEYREFFRLLLD